MHIVGAQLILSLPKQFSKFMTWKTTSSRNKESQNGRLRADSGGITLNLVRIRVPKINPPDSSRSCALSSTSIVNPILHKIIFGSKFVNVSEFALCSLW